MFKPGAAQDGFSRILANTGWLLGGKGVGAVLSLAYLAIVTRTLGVADFGRFALVLSAATVIKTITSFDSWQIVVRYGQTHLAADNGDALNRVLRFCIMIDLASAAVGGAIAAVIILAFGGLLELPPGMGWQAWLFCMVMMITIRSSPTGILRLFDRFDSAALAETMIPVGRMIGAGRRALADADDYRLSDRLGRGGTIMCARILVARFARRARADRRVARGDGRWTRGRKIPALSVS
jgi:O-antigen/teichoic acid export membrane protein